MLSMYEYCAEEQVLCQLKKVNVDEMIIIWFGNSVERAAEKMRIGRDNQHHVR